MKQLELNTIQPEQKAFDSGMVAGAIFTIAGLGYLVGMYIFIYPLVVLYAQGAWYLIEQIAKAICS